MIFAGTVIPKLNASSLTCLLLPHEFVTYLLIPCPSSIPIFQGITCQYIVPNLPPADTPSLFHSYFQACCSWLLQDRTALTRCGLVMSYGDIDQGQHCFRQWLVTWQHQANTWTNVAIYQNIPRTIKQEMPITPSILCVRILHFCCEISTTSPWGQWVNLCLGPHLGNMLCCV